MLFAMIRGAGERILTIDKSHWYNLTVECGFDVEFSRIPATEVRWAKLVDGQWQPILDDDGNELVQGPQFSNHHIIRLEAGDQLKAIVACAVFEVMLRAVMQDANYGQQIGRQTSKAGQAEYFGGSYQQLPPPVP